MQMDYDYDYDDDDRKSTRRTSIASPDNRSKSSSVLYDFPKFYFDDDNNNHNETLQAPLPFHTLVETEVFLGIQTQQDNHWIQDFTPATNGMEFNSDPAHPCTSISRPDNVWSEATSSESVEMLLKSVGQEDIMVLPTEPTVPDSTTQEPLSLEQQDTTALDAQNYNLQVTNPEAGSPLDSSFQESDTNMSIRQGLEKLPQVETHSTVVADAAPHGGDMLTIKGNCSDNQESATEELKESILPSGDPVLCQIDDNPCDAIPKNSGKAELGNADEEKHVSTVTEQNEPVVLQDRPVDGCINIHAPSSSLSDCPDVLQESLHSVEEANDVSTDGNSGEQKSSSITTSVKDKDTEVLPANSEEPDLIRDLATEGNFVRQSSSEDNRSSSITTPVQDKDTEVLPANREEPEPMRDVSTEGNFVLQSSSGGNRSSSITTPVQDEDSGVLPANSEDAEIIKNNLNVSAEDIVNCHSVAEDASHCAGMEQKIGVTGQMTCRQENTTDNPFKNETIEQMPSSGIEGEATLSSCDNTGKSDENGSSDVAMLSAAAENRTTEVVEDCHCDNVATVRELVSELPTHLMDECPGAGGNSARALSNVSQSDQINHKAEEVVKERVAGAGNVDVENFEMLDTDPRALPMDSNTGSKGDHSGNGQSVPAVSGLSHSDIEIKEARARVASAVDGSSEIDGNTKVEVSVTSGEPVKKSNGESGSLCSPSMNPLDPTYSDVQLASGKAKLDESVGIDSVDERQREVTSLQEEKESAGDTEVDKASCGSPTIISSSEPSQLDKENHAEVRISEVTDKSSKSTEPSSMSLDMKDAVVDDTSFTFKVNAVPDTAEREPGSGWSPLVTTEKRNLSTVAEGTTPCSESKTAMSSSQETPHVSAQLSEGQPVHVTQKGTSERKGRRASAKGMIKENAKKEKQAKSTNKDPLSAKKDKVSSTLFSTSHGDQQGQIGSVQPFGYGEHTNTMLPGSVTVTSSSLPDLSASASKGSSSLQASFLQPFTDLQQVQLRAQIFVYGSLIQGTAPDEACMVSAFGPPDGSRGIWEPVWRAAVDRFRSQKSTCSAPETPLHSQPSARASDAAVKQGSHSSKVLSSPVGRASSKGTSAAVVNPIIPLSSPLWNVSTPSRDSLAVASPHKGPTANYQHPVTSLQSFQTPPIRNFVGHTSWPSQTSWMTSPQTPFNSNICFQPVTLTEPVKLTPVKDNPGLLTSGVKQMTSSPVTQTVSPSPVLAGVSMPPDSKTVASVEKKTVDSKPRKRKKNPASDPGPTPFVFEARIEQSIIPSQAPTLPSTLSSTTPVVLPMPCHASGTPPAIGFAPTHSLPSAFTQALPHPTACPAADPTLSKAIVDGSAKYSTDPSKEGDMEIGKVLPYSDDTLCKVSEAKREAESSAAHAAAAVTYCEDLWCRLAKEKESGVTSDGQAKIFSAAAAVAAAASVAKAASAAAKVACNAALQAKLMADEAFLSSKSSGSMSSSGDYFAGVYDIGCADPASILKGDSVKDQSSSILVAAKEATKRRVEAASAASKQAENLDAIVKAAELAAAAVSQAGKIVAMGEPLPLSDLVDAGPEGYWKLLEPHSVSAEELKDGNNEKVGSFTFRERDHSSAKSFREVSVETGGDGVMNSSLAGGRDVSVGEVSNMADLPKPGADPGAAGVPNDHADVNAPSVDSIKEGSAVEVFKHGEILKLAWYAATVLTIENAKAFVSYNHILSEEGSGNLKEWVPLESEGDKAPVIRPAHISTTLAVQQTKKRPRAALVDYAWHVGDKVDVWIDDCWWEGVVTEKDEKDETTLKVHFPAQGETSTVKAWDLRTSRSWNDGKWIEWPYSKGRNASERSDTPREKRQKLRSSVVPNKATDISAGGQDSACGKVEEAKLPLTTNDTVFAIGKTTKEENKRAARKPLRAGQQKEGSRVIFGVPKPTGKKRKFMEVSKHFAANRSGKSNKNDDTLKFAQNSTVQGTATRAWRVPGRNDSKEKQITRSKGPNTRMSHRNLPRRNNVQSTVAEDSNKATDRGNDHEKSLGHEDSTTEKLEEDSASEEAVEAPLSSLLSHSLGTSSKKISTLSSRSERLNRGRAVLSSAKLSKIEEEKIHAGLASRPGLDAEPRRSNRRIQPTHRLLEGLQSSLVIPKMPAMSHDIGQKNQNRSFSARGK